MKTKDKYKIYRPKKFLGQNFLVDDNISKKIVKQLDLQDCDIVLEIGPGQGALTKHLAGFCKNYYAIEIDKNIAESLEDKFGETASIINEDFLKFDFNMLNEPVKIVGNLPYNIASEILFKLFDNREKILFAVIMVQKEFASRLTATPDTKEYGILSVQSQAFSKPKLLFNVPPTVFFPKPKVESSVVLIDFRDMKNEIRNSNTFKTLVRTAFGKRRKTLKNSLKELFEELKLGFVKYESIIDFSKRAENIRVEKYIELANEIYLNTKDNVE